MAKSISDEELQLRKRARRRLVGAIALVTIIAVFLPMVLENEPKSINQDISVQIPSQNAGAFTSKIVPVPAAPETKAASPKAETPLPPAATTKESEAAALKAAPSETAAPKSEPKGAPAVKHEKPKPVPVTTAKADAKPATKTKAEPAKAAGSGYVVQVAALNDADKAKQMQQQIAASGVNSYTEVVPTAKGNVTRVRVGPYPTREAAEKARDQLKGMGLGGNVVPK